MAAERLNSILHHLAPSKSGLTAITQKNPDDVVITLALRTPLTKGFKGGFKDTPLDYIVYSLLKQVLEKSRVDPQVVEDICLGNVNNANAAYIVRAAGLAAGFPNTAAASSVNRFCSSGLKAVQDVANQIVTGSIEVGIAIGAESMSEGGKPPSFHEEILTNQEALDCMQPMGQTSENVGKDFDISREAQDRFAAESYQRAERAQKSGWFDDEIVPITTVVKDPNSGEARTVTLTRDEGPRYGTTFESLSKIRPAFPQFGDRSTGGNSSQVTDGAAAVLLMKRSKAIALNQPILAKYCGATVTGLAPRVMGIGPSIAIPKLLAKFNLNLATDIDIIELNEAFASMAVYCIQTLKIDPTRMNVRGGAIALGHPLGATGVRQICTGLSECRRQKKKVLLTSMCIGTGQGMAGLFVNEQFTVYAKLCRNSSHLPAIDWPINPLTTSLGYGLKESFVNTASMDRARKRDLRDTNARVWAGDRNVFSTNNSLDSSLKKNTAFIKRLRTAITSSSTVIFIQEIRSLSLQKYLSEIISASYEGLCKLKTPGEIAAGVEITSALHQRFGYADFTVYLGWLLGRGLSTPEKAHLKALGQDAKEKEEKERLGRQRVLLRVATELWLVGILRSLDDVVRPDDAAARLKENTSGVGNKLAEAPGKAKAAQGPSKIDRDADAEPFPLEVLKDLLGHDKEHVNLPLVVQFVKSFGSDILGIKSSAEGRKTVDVDGSIVIDATVADGGNSSSTEDETTNRIKPAADDSPLVGSELQQRFRNILERYFEDVKVHIGKDHKAILAQARRNAEAYVKSGEVFEDRQANHEKLLKAQEKLLADAQILCDALGNQEMPDLSEKEVQDSTGASGIGLVKTGEYLRGQTEGAGIWEDDEERRFYENLIDLQERVPILLLVDVKKKKAEGDEQQVGKRVESVNNGDVQDKPSSGPLTEDQSIAIANKTVGAQVDALLARMPDFLNKEMVDQAAIDFCFVNSKASRNRLLKALQEVPKGRMDLLPSYSRLVATLSKYMPEISHGLVSYLDDEFRSLQRRKQKDFLGQARTGNIRYLAELTKFGVVPEHVIFHCLKVSLDDFSRMNIEIMCNLLENCGRYLLRNPDTARRMNNFLETLQRKKSAQHIGQQERMLIENALYYVSPPERAAIQQKERTPVELFVSKLVYLDMNKRTYTKVLKSIRKLHWEEQDVVDIMEKIFSKPGKVKYSNIHLLAVLVGSLYRYHQDFVIMVIDNVLEQITLGLEQNDFQFNQRRIAEVKYLGELYNYKMVDSPVIFDALYRIVTFGHVGGTPSRDKLNVLDLPDDFFRIRLVCTLLDTCGVCFDRGAAKKKLDFFLTFFQYYYHTKDPLPMDIDFIIQDTYALTRPQWKLAPNLEEAGRAFAESVAQNYQSQEPDKAVEAETFDDDGFSEDEGDDDDVKLRDNDSSNEENEAEILSNGNPSADSDFEQDIVVTRQHETVDPEAEADFDREFAKMMTESLDSRKFDRKPLFDVPLPMRRAQRDIPMAGDESPVEGTSTPPNPNTMAFSLMTKKGNKQQTKSIELPSDSHFAIAVRSKREAERAEQQRIKNLVLNYDLQESNVEQIGIYAHIGFAQGPDGVERHGNSHHHQANASQHYPSSSSSANGNARPAGGPGTNRNGQRARKLQLSDVDWHDQKPGPPQRGSGRGAPHRTNG